jgi:hypothetical protein
MFSKDQFIEDCKSAAEEGQSAVRAVVERAVSDPAAIMRELGAPEVAGIEPIYHSDYPKCDLAAFHERDAAQS